VPAVEARLHGRRLERVLLGDGAAEEVLDRHAEPGGGRQRVGNKIVSNTRFTEKVDNSMRVKYFFINSECVSQVE
jgi:hypothetical protein